MKLKLTKRWYETRSKAEEKCMDVAAARSLTVTAKKSAGKKKATTAPTATTTAVASKRRAK